MRPSNAPTGTGKFTLCRACFTDKAQEAFIFDSLAEDANHDIMVDIVKEAFKYHQLVILQVIAS